MADEKKISAKEAGIAVLKKFEELLIKAAKEKNIGIEQLTKAQPLAKQDETPPAQPSSPPSSMGNTATSGGTSTINSAIGNPFGKQEEGGKEFKGHIKLAKFIGHISGKKSGKAPADMDKGETGHEKGINTSTDPSQKSRVMMGTSKAGSTLPGHANDPKQKIADESEAKGKHKQVLGEMKQMPKPKLPG